MVEGLGSGRVGRASGGRVGALAERREAGSVGSCLCVVVDAAPVGRDVNLAWPRRERVDP